MFSIQQMIFTCTFGHIISILFQLFLSKISRFSSATTIIYLPGAGQINHAGGINIASASHVGRRS